MFCLTSVHEDEPGPKWQKLFNKYWPQYRRWFLAQGQHARAGYVTSTEQLRTHMPELEPIYEQLVELAGGDDIAARFLSLYRPPPYLFGCSQAVWTGPRPVLVRNYDYNPSLFEWTLLRTCWRRPVIAMSDCLWEVLDGMNDAGLTVSLAFGGHQATGDGFGVPLVLRYVLEVCDDVSQACEVLRRVAVHMAYNITLVDRTGTFITAFLAPGGEPRFTSSPVSTNHQDRIEWPTHERMNSSLERLAFLEHRLTEQQETRATFIDRFLHPPIHRIHYEQAFGTLYTAVYDPTELTVDYCWPRATGLRQSFSRFREGHKLVCLAIHNEAC